MLKQAGGDSSIYLHCAFYYFNEQHENQSLSINVQKDGRKRLTSCNLIITGVPQQHVMEQLFFSIPPRYANDPLKVTYALCLDSETA